MQLIQYNIFDFVLFFPGLLISRQVFRRVFGLARSESRAVKENEKKISWCVILQLHAAWSSFQGFS